MGIGDRRYKGKAMELNESMRIAPMEIGKQNGAGERKDQRIRKATN